MDSDLGGIANRLKADMLAGRLAPGAELGQIALAERFGVSRIPIRDAIRELVGEGLVIASPNRGATVISLGADEIREVYDLRILLECDCVQRAAKRIKPSDYGQLEYACRRSELDSTSPNWAESEWGFHRILYEFADRPRQLAMIKKLRETSQIHIEAYRSLPEKHTIWNKDHEEMVEALKNRDTDLACAILERHLDDSAVYLIARLSAVSRSTTDPNLALMAPVRVGSEVATLSE